MNYSKFVSLVKRTGWLRFFFKDDVRIVDDKVLIKGYCPTMKQYMLLGDEKGMKELKDQENLSEVKRDPCI